MKELLKEATVKAVSLISVLFVAWILVSWADVVAHNVSDYSYASWNLFQILF